MNWQDELKKNICSVEQLKGYINLSPEEEKLLRLVVKRLPMSITPYYISLIDWSDPDDPIRRMAVPSREELNLAGSYDTSGERSNTKITGLQHKYPQTALILSTNRCAMYCRYCFRRRLMSKKNKETLQNIDDVVNYIRDHKEITNVLISGGDPLLLPTDNIENILERLSKIEHIGFIRFGTRVPVTFPERVLKDETLLKMLKKYSTKNKKIYLVTQFNHPREITTKTIRATNKLMNAGIILNNQTVLLKKVNDNPHTLAELQNRLVSIGINPYYVFHCRPAKGIKHHFQPTLLKGYNVVEQARNMLSGHSKRFKYVLSNKKGKVEIVSVTDKHFYFKYHQAKDPSNSGKFFTRKLSEDTKWLNY